MKKQTTYTPLDNQGIPLIMKRMEILCPNCMKKKVIHETEHTAYCDECGQHYKLSGAATLTFK